MGIPLKHQKGSHGITRGKSPVLSQSFFGWNRLYRGDPFYYWNPPFIKGIPCITGIILLWRNPFHRGYISPFLKESPVLLEITFNWGNPLWLRESTVLLEIPFNRGNPLWLRESSLTERIPFDEGNPLYYRKKSPLTEGIPCDSGNPLWLRESPWLKESPLLRESLWLRMRTWNCRPCVCWPGEVNPLPPTPENCCRSWSSRCCCWCCSRSLWRTCCEMVGPCWEPGGSSCVGGWGPPAFIAENTQYIIVYKLQFINKYTIYKFKVFSINFQDLHIFSFSRTWHFIYLLYILTD